VDAVEFLHQQRICHGDIKDENILLDENNHVSLIDFGAAQELGITNNKHFKGTVQYQAPEVFSIHDYDNEKAECWSLGIVLYALLFKRMPFSSLQEIREGHVKCWNPKYVGGYKVCLGFLEKDPDIRCNIEQIKKQSWLIK
jgi:serine/threonine protein kinase